MGQSVKRIAITGGAGQIAYQLLFRIAHGELFGSEQPIALHILELPDVLKPLEGVRMELEDCAFPLLEEVRIGSDPEKIFDQVDFALLVGAKPRGPGMERKDLLRENSKIFIEQGRALNEGAKHDVKVFVVGNPCNTNCLIAMSHAPRIPKKNFFAMTRLDQNRATHLLARKAKVKVKNVSNVTIWGNHSSTQVPDFYHAKVNGKPVSAVIQDVQWLETEFVAQVQKRGAAVIEARGKSSAASAAHALIQAVKDIVYPTEKGNWFSSGVLSTGNPYGINDDLVFSFPCFSHGEGKYEIISDLSMNEFLESKLQATEKELIEERDLIRETLKF